VPAEIAGLALDVAAHSLLAGVVGAGFGRGGGIAGFGDQGRGAFGDVDHVSQALPAGQRVAIYLAVTLGHGAEIVGSVAQRGLRFGVKFVEAGLTRFCGAAGRVHTGLSIRVVSHEQTIRNAWIWDNGEPSAAAGPIHQSEQPRGSIVWRFRRRRGCPATPFRRRFGARSAASTRIGGPGPLRLRRFLGQRQGCDVCRFSEPDRLSVMIGALAASGTPARFRAAGRAS